MKKEVAEKKVAKKKVAKKKVAKKKVAEKAPKFVPLHDNVLIEKDKAGEERKTKGGLFIPGSADKPKNTAKVVAVGPEVDGIVEGDTVVVGSFSGTDVAVGEDEYVVVGFSDILGLYK